MPDKPTPDTPDVVTTPVEETQSPKRVDGLVRSYTRDALDEITAEIQREKRDRRTTADE